MTERDTRSQTDPPQADEQEKQPESATRRQRGAHAAPLPEMLPDPPAFPVYLIGDETAALERVPITFATGGVDGRYPLAFDGVRQSLKIYLSIWLRAWRYLLHGAGWELGRADDRLAGGIFGEREARYFWSYSTLLDTSQRNTPKFMPCTSTEVFNSSFTAAGKQYKPPARIDSPLMDWELGHFNKVRVLGKASLYAAHIQPARARLGNSLRKGHKPRHPEKNDKPGTIELGLLGDRDKQFLYRPTFPELLCIAAYGHIDPSLIWRSAYHVRGHFHLASAAGYSSEGFRPERLSAEGEAALNDWACPTDGPAEKESDLDRGRQLLLKLVLDDMISGDERSDFERFCYHLGYCIERSIDGKDQVRFCLPE